MTRGDRVAERRAAEYLRRLAAAATPRQRLHVADLYVMSALACAERRGEDIAAVVDALVPARANEADHLLRGAA